MSPDPRDGASCEEIALRLIGGERAARDGALAEHVGSCLRCFRTASDLREVPRIEALLREGAADADPGPAFWARFPTAVADAWERAAAAPAEPAAPSTPMPGRISWIRHLPSWLRLPLPAALAGAAVAGALVYLAVHAPPPPAPRAAAAVPAAADDPWSRGEEVDPDTLAGLDLEQLLSLLEEVEGQTPLAVGEEYFPVTPSPVEELDELEVEELEVLAEGFPSRI
jgi:hypothetical protein